MSSDRNTDVDAGGEQVPKVPDAAPDAAPDDDGCGCGEDCGCGDGPSSSRRNVLKAAAGGAAALSAPSVAEEVMPSSDQQIEKVAQQVLQKHYKKMTEAEKESLIQRLEEEYEHHYGRDVDVGTEEPKEDVVFGYALNIKKCIGCRRCVQACHEENNQSRYDPDKPKSFELNWIRVLEIPSFEYDDEGHRVGGIGSKWGDVVSGISYEESDNYYEAEEVPEEDNFYLPVQCQQCENPPCVKVCPVQATWKEDDGIVTVDYRWCIGCKYCVVACPYYARRFNLSHPNLPEEEINTDTHYLGNRPRPHEVVEKCTFCIQRTRNDEYPACVETCPVGARKFGNLLDPDSEVRQIIENKKVFRLKQDLGTKPKFFYYME